MYELKEIIVIFLVLHNTLGAANLPPKGTTPPAPATKITPNEDNLFNNNIVTDETDVVEATTTVKPTDMNVKHIDPHTFKMAHIIGIGLTVLMIICLVLSVYLMKKRRKKQMAEKLVKASKIIRIMGETNDAFDPVDSNITISVQRPRQMTLLNDNPNYIRPHSSSNLAVKSKRSRTLSSIKDYVLKNIMGDIERSFMYKEVQTNHHCDNL